MQIANDTIVAISTPAGRGGIGIVRLSGPEAKAIAESLVRLRHGLEPGRARFAKVLDEFPDQDKCVGPSAALRSGRDDASRLNGTDAERVAVLDEAVVTYFAAPRSYTGEDVVEIAAHGAPVLLDYLLRQCVSRGARMAEPGEFTQRAFLSGRIDLTQAEGVHGLIAATTLEQARTAAQQLGGALSRQVQPVKRRLIELIAALEAGIDFAEDDLDLMAEEEIARRIREIEFPLQVMERSFEYGRVLREGFRLAIVGRPNAGKSSLFNRLIGRDRAIVTAQPGTTRDTIAERMDLAGIPVELIDTAGLRAASASGETLDEAELFGVAKSREAMAEADVVLLVVAANEALHEEDRAVIGAGVVRPFVVAVNKVDLVEAGKGLGLPTHREGHHRVGQERDGWGTEFEGTGLEGAIRTSATEGTGIEELRRAILEAVKGTPESVDTVPLTNLRQHQAISNALKAVRSAERGAAEKMPHEMLLLDLHECLDELDVLTGTTHTEEILGVIFASFCIGK